MGSYQHIKVDCSLGPVGAEISGVDLSKPLAPEVVAEIHQAWLDHHVVFFHLLLVDCSIHHDFH